MTPRWAGKGPNARRRAEKYLDDTLRPDNEAGGPFPAHPFGATCFSPRLGGAPPRRIVRIDTARRRYLMRGENHVVAGSLGFVRGSKWKPVQHCRSAPPRRPGPRGSSDTTRINC